MPLSAGARLGPYEIVTPIGAGGMGEVYKGTDTRLHRTVAIKVLPHAIADDADCRARFEREARVVAALEHPHICGIFDVGTADGIHFLVMPYVEGEPLSTRLQKGPLPLEQALRIAIDLADALEQAHRHSIVHRDVKPSSTRPLHERTYLKNLREDPGHIGFEQRRQSSHVCSTSNRNAANLETGVDKSKRGSLVLIWSV